MKTFSRILSGMALAAGTLAAGQAAAETMRIGHSTWVGYGPFFIAEEEGYFEDEGLDVELVKLEDPKVRFAALSGGRIDALATTVDTMPLYLKPDYTMQYLFAVDDSTGGDGMVADSDITSIEDLKGKQVAYNEGTVSEFYINVLLREAGMAPGDIESVNMTQADAGSAFVTQQVDAAVTWEPWLSRAEQTEHGHVLHTSAETPGLITDVVLAPAETVEKRMDEFKALYRAWLRAVEFVETNPDEAYEIMARGVGGWLKDPETFAETLEGVTYYGKARNETFFGTKENPGQIEDTLQKAIDVWSDLGRLQVDPDPDELIVYEVVNQ